MLSSRSADRSHRKRRLRRPTSSTNDSSCAGQLYCKHGSRDLLHPRQAAPSPSALGDSSSSSTVASSFSSTSSNFVSSSSELISSTTTTSASSDVSSGAGFTTTVTTTVSITPPIVTVSSLSISILSVTLTNTNIEITTIPVTFTSPSSTSDTSRLASETSRPTETTTQEKTTTVAVTSTVGGFIPSPSAVTVTRTVSLTLSPQTTTVVHTSTFIKNTTLTLTGDVTTTTVQETSSLNHDNQGKTAAFFHNPGAVAGISVAAFLVVTLLVVWIVFAIRRHRRKQEITTALGASTQTREHDNWSPQRRSMLQEDDDDWTNAQRTRTRDTDRATGITVSDATSGAELLKNRQPSDDDLHDAEDHADDGAFAITSDEAVPATAPVLASILDRPGLRRRAKSIASLVEAAGIVDPSRVGVDHEWSAGDASQRDLPALPSSPTALSSSHGHSSQDHSSQSHSVSHTSHSHASTSYGSSSHTSFSSSSRGHSRVQSLGMTASSNTPGSVAQPTPPLPDNIVRVKRGRSKVSFTLQQPPSRAERARRSPTLHESPPSPLMPVFNTISPSPSPQSPSPPVGLSPDSDSLSNTDTRLSAHAIFGSQPHPPSSECTSADPLDSEDYSRRLGVSPGFFPSTPTPGTETEPPIQT